ncbi:MAG: hypothetical protein HUU01_01115 [Saprospiraceae bacterium]|nr:hypothetical protein [Saprospiraceae bacterium]
MTIMFLNRKRHIKLLADKFAYSITYGNDFIILCNSLNKIRITDTDKYSVLISYDTQTGNTNYIANEEDIIDTLYEFLRHDKLETIQKKSGKLLTLKDYIDGEGLFFENKIKEIIKELNSGTNTHKFLGGNRIEGEIYKDTLILVDDLMFFKTNMIDLIDCQI